MKNFKWTSLFGLIVILLIGFTIYDFRKSGRDEEAKERDSKVVTLEQDQISAIEFTSLDARDHSTANLRRLEKKEGLWHVVSPFQDSADQQAVASFLESLETEKIIETVAENIEENGDSLTKFGLDKPLFTLKLEAGDKGETLKLGTIKAYDGSLYGRIETSNIEPAANGNRIVLLSSAWSVYLSKPARELRDKRVYRRDMAAKITRLKLSGALDGRTVDFELKRNDKGAWIATKNPSLKISEKSVDAYLEQVKAMRAFDFTTIATTNPAALKSIGLDKPAYAIEVDTEGIDTPFSFAFAFERSKSEANIEAKSSDLPLAVAVYKVAARSLMKEPKDFFDRQAPFSFAVNDVERIEITSNASQVGFEKKAGSWSQIGLQSAADSTKLNELLQKLSRLEAVRFLTPASVSKLSMNSRIRLSKADGSLVFEMTWGEAMTEKAEGDKPEAIILPVRTSVSKDPVAVAEGLVTGLDLQNLAPSK